MRRLLILAVAFGGYALSAQTLSESEVRAACANAYPEPNPGWQDIDFKASGGVKKTKTGYTLQGAMWGEAGTCVVTLGKKDAVFKLADPKGAQLRFQEGAKALDFESRCMDVVAKNAGIPDYYGVGYERLNGPKRLGGSYSFSGAVLNQPFTCTGTPAKPMVRFLNKNAPKIIRDRRAALLQAKRDETPLNVISWKCTHDGDYVHLIGEVKNVSSHVLENVRVGVTVHDSSGLVATDDRFLKYKRLRPDEVSPFEVYTDTGGRGESCDFEFSSLDGDRIPHADSP